MIIPRPRRGSSPIGAVPARPSTGPTTCRALTEGSGPAVPIEGLAELEVQVDRSRTRWLRGRLPRRPDRQRSPCSPPGPRRARRATTTSGVAAANSPFWSMDCGAPVSCSSGGRSAVHTMSGTPAWCASTTAGCSSTAAVPLVTQMTVGRPVAIAEPEREERAAALVEPDVDAEPFGQGQRQWRRARAGADDGIGDAEADPLVDQGGAEGGLYAHPSCHSMSRCAGSGPPLVAAARLHPDGSPLGTFRRRSSRRRTRWSPSICPATADSGSVRADLPDDGRPGGRGGASDGSATSRVPFSAIRWAPGSPCMWHSAPTCR